MLPKMKIATKRRRNRRKRNPLVARKANAPAAFGREYKAEDATFRRTAKGVIITNRESIGVVSGTTGNDYVISQSYSINPGLSATFPWLSAIAGRYERYLFRRLQFSFVPYGGTSTYGFVGLAVDYDACDAAPTTDAQITSMSGFVTTQIWRSISYNADPKRMNADYGRRYVRLGPVTTDLRTSDVGSLHVSTANCPNTGAIGRVFVSYDIELFIPQLPTGEVQDYIFTLKRTSDQTLTTGVEATIAFQTDIDVGTLFTNSSGVLTCKIPGRYLLFTEFDVDCDAANDTKVQGRVNVAGTDYFTENTGGGLSDSATNCVFSKVIDLSLGDVITQYATATAVSGTLTLMAVTARSIFRLMSSSKTTP
jgi:hypothetical protein